ncbi:MAG: nuclear transport factor 2 family protein [Deltaproteobacteria bacterium]|nr:nuclear transport factor 2 family protein [Deltaproteobacteria bacterium]
MKTSQPEVELGEKLVRQLWADIKDRNTEGAGKMIAQGFQSVHQDGARNREQEIGLIKELDLGKYNLSDFTVTQNGPVIGKRLSTEAAPRLDVFLKTDSGWQLIAHANLKPLT